MPTVYFETMRYFCVIHTQNVLRYIGTHLHEILTHMRSHSQLGMRLAYIHDARICLLVHTWINLCATRVPKIFYPNQKLRLFMCKQAKWHDNLKQLLHLENKMASDLEFDPDNIKVTIGGQEAFENGASPPSKARVKHESVNMWDDDQIDCLLYTSPSPRD